MKTRPCQLNRIGSDRLDFVYLLRFHREGYFFQIILQPDAVTAWILQWLLCKHGDDMTQEGNLDISCQDG